MKKLALALLALLICVPASAQTTGQPIVTAARPTALQLLQSSGGTTWAPVTVGGDAYAANSAGLFYVSGLTGLSSVVAMKAPLLQWSTALTPSIGQASTTSATGANFTISPQASTATNGTPGNFVANLTPPTGTGTEPAFIVTRGSGNSEIQFGAYPGNPSYYGIWAGLGTTAASSNFLYLGNQSLSRFNVPGGGTVSLSVNNADILAATGSGIQASYAITGNPSYSSPYNVHGYVSVALSATPTTLTAAQYANHFIEFTGTFTTSYTVTLPCGNGSTWALADSSTGSGGTIHAQCSGQVLIAPVLPHAGATGQKFTAYMSDGTSIRLAE